MNHNLMPHSGIIWQAATIETMPSDDLQVICMNADNEAGIGQLYHDERHGFFCATESGQIDGVTKWAHITDYVFPELYVDNKAHMEEYLTKFYRHPHNRVLRYAFILREKDNHLRLAKTVQLQTLPTDEELKQIRSSFAPKNSMIAAMDFNNGWDAAISYIKKLMQID